MPNKSSGRGQVVRKPINTSPGFKGGCGSHFSCCITVFFIAYVLWNFILVYVRTGDKNI